MAVVTTDTQINESITNKPEKPIEDTPTNDDKKEPQKQASKDEEEIKIIEEEEKKIDIKVNESLPSQQHSDYTESPRDRSSLNAQATPSSKLSISNDSQSASKSKVNIK